MTRHLGWGFAALGALAALVFLAQLLGRYIELWSDHNGFGWALGLTWRAERSWLLFGAFFILLGAALLTQPMRRIARGWRRDAALTLRLVAGLALATSVFEVLRSAYGFASWMLRADGSLGGVLHILHPGLITATLPALALWTLGNLVVWRAQSTTRAVVPDAG